MEGKPQESQASFIPKLFAMVSDPSIPQIQWSSTGTYFIILNPIEFAEKVLPVQFKHNNFTSFVRQLNMYGFHKVADLAHLPVSSSSSSSSSSSAAAPSSRSWAFEHHAFLRNQPHLLPEIQRRPKPTLQRRAGSPFVPSSPSSSSSPVSSASLITEEQVKKGRLVVEELLQVKQHQRQMKQEFSQAKHQQATLIKQLQQARASLREQQGVSQQVFSFLRACLQQNHVALPAATSRPSRSSLTAAAAAPSPSTPRASAPAALVPQSKPSPFRPLFPQSSAESPAAVPQSPFDDEMDDDENERLSLDLQHCFLMREKEKEKEKERQVPSGASDYFNCGGSSGSSSSSSSRSHSGTGLTFPEDDSVPFLPEELPQRSDLHFQEELRIDLLTSFDEGNGLGIGAEMGIGNDVIPRHNSLDEVPFF